MEGEDKPYTLRGKAYRRSDTSTVEADRLAFNRLILEGSGTNFEELPAKNQEPQFTVLSRFLKEKLDIPDIDRNILKTLGLCSAKGEFNIAAALLADGNDFPGIDIVRFGSSIDEIMDRRTVEKQSVLAQYEQAVGLFRTYYQMEKNRRHGADKSGACAGESLPRDRCKRAGSQAVGYKRAYQNRNVLGQNFSYISGPASSGNQRGRISCRPHFAAQKSHCRLRVFPSETY